ncbi:MAG TPA: dihydrodipicolinate synthase family protein [Pseudorhodoferax sp.]|nr:dihydrodipicolinate synthase family protein [Pseudorhodoferax sp.]
MVQRIRGVLAPVLTPFDAELQPDFARYLAHCQWLLSQNAGLAIFGTNSEAASVSTALRLSLTDRLLEAGIPAAKLMPGTGACALDDAVALTRHATRIGAAGALMLPPFYFKGVSDEGLFAYYAEVIERVGSGCVPIYLYHIPQFTQVPITLKLIERLRKRYPEVIAGAKDSSGDWANSKAMIDHFAQDGFDVFPASESLLSQSMPIGGAGCISATANINPAGIHALIQGWHGAEGAALQASADVVRNIFTAVPMIPAMKYVVGHFADHAQWRTVRPPLVAVDDAVGRPVLEQLAAARFDLPDYPTRVAAR